MANNGNGGQGGGRGGGQGGGDPKITLVFLINGDPQEVTVNPQQKLAAARAEALRLSENLSREADEWIVRTVAGAVLDPAKKIRDFDLKDGDKLVLSLTTGSGG